MTGGDKVGVQLTRPLPQQVELEVAVAQQAGVRRAPVEVLIGEDVDHAATERLPEVQDVVRDAQVVSHAAGVLKIIDRAAAPLMPFGVAGKQHGNGNDLIASLNQEGRGYGAVYSTAESGEDALATGFARRVLRNEDGGLRCQHRGFWVLNSEFWTLAGC